MKKSTIFLLAAAALLLLSGCGYFNQFDNFENAGKLRRGMTKDEVRKIMGEPENEFFSKPDVWYYYIETRWHDGQVTEDECMPLVFKQGKLAGWGKDYYAREKLERNRYAQPVIEGLK